VWRNPQPNNIHLNLDGTFTGCVPDYSTPCSAPLDGRVTAGSPAQIQFTIHFTAYPGDMTFSGTMFLPAAGPAAIRKVVDGGHTVGELDFGGTRHDGRALRLLRSDHGLDRPAMGEASDLVDIDGLRQRQEIPACPRACVAEAGSS
jgi:hypothetical protein